MRLGAEEVPRYYEFLHKTDEEPQSAEEVKKTMKEKMDRLFGKEVNE